MGFRVASKQTSTLWQGSALMVQVRAVESSLWAAFQPFSIPIDAEAGRRVCRLFAATSIRRFKQTVSAARDQRQHLSAR